MTVAFAIALTACATPSGGPLVVKETVEVTVAAPVSNSIRGYTFTGQKYPDGTKISFSTGMSNDERCILTQDIALFKQITNIDVEYVDVPDEGKLNAMIAAGNAPDLNYCDTPGIRAADGTLAPIDEYVDQATLDQFPKVFVEQYRGFDGKLYGLQIGGWFPIVLVNTKMIEAAGEEVPGVDWTYDDVIRIGQKLTKDAHGKTPLDADFDPSKVDVYGFFGNWFFHEPLVFSNGITRVDDTGTKLLIDSPEYIATQQLWADMVNKYRVQPPDTWGGELGMGLNEAFLAGKLAMHAEGIHIYDMFRRANETFGEGGWKMLPFPHPNGKKLVLPRFPGGACLMKTAKNPAAAVEFLKFLTFGAQVWYPNLWVKSHDYVGEWEKVYPFLKNAGFRETVEYSTPKIGPNPWHWKSTPFDVNRYTQGWDYWDKWGQVMSGKLPFDQFDFKAYATEWNAKIVEGLEKDLTQATLQPEWRKALEEIVADRKKELGQ